MEALDKFLVSEWYGVPAFVWILAGVVLLLVPIRITRKTKKGEFTLETKPPPGKRKTSSARQKKKPI